MAIYFEPTHVISGDGFRRSGDKHVYTVDEMLARATSGTMLRTDFEANYTVSGRVSAADVGRIYKAFEARENWAPIATLPKYERRYNGTEEEVRAKEGLNAADITYVYIVADDDGNFNDEDVITAKEFERIKKFKDLKDVKIVARFKNAEGDFEYIGDGKSVIPKKFKATDASDDDDDDVADIDTSDDDDDDDDTSSSPVSSDIKKKATIKNGKDEKGKAVRWALFIKASKKPVSEEFARSIIKLGLAKEEDFGYAKFTEFDGEIHCTKTPAWDEAPEFKAKKKRNK